MGFPIQKERTKMTRKNVPTIKSGNPWTAKDEESIATMVDLGFTEAEIGDALGRSAKSIQVRKVRIRARAGKIKAYNKATDVVINEAITMTEAELEFVRKHEQQWADFREGYMSVGKTEGIANPYLPRSLDMATMDQFMSDEDSEVSPENNKNTYTGYTTLRVPHTYLYACVVAVVIAASFYLGSIYQ